MSDTPKARRKIKRHPVVPAVLVNGRTFLDARHGEIWSDVLYRAETWVVNNKPDLSEKRIDSAVLERAEALFEYAKETDATPTNSGATDDDAADDSSRVYVQDAGESGGYTNGSDAHVN